eukprot:5855104-Prymnesium_polylepis.1
MSARPRATSRTAAPHCRELSLSALRLGRGPALIVVLESCFLITICRGALDSTLLTARRQRTAVAAAPAIISTAGGR